mgnify:CR=1 FL=1
MEMEKITDGKVVTLSYVLTADGEEVARTEDGDPLEYLHGAEDILPGLETALEGKAVGDKFTVTLAPDDAYGDYDEDDIEEVDKSDIPNVDELELGMMVEVEDEDGYSYMAYVAEIGDDVVTLDFNHPLAGKTLTYEGQIISVRAATEEELDHGHVHGAWNGYEFEEDDEEYEADDEE